MHADIAATVAREHTPGLSAAAASRLEEVLHRSPTLLELEVYAALLGVPGGLSSFDWRVALGPGTTAVLTVVSGRGAVVEAALGLAAAGAQPLAIGIGRSGADDPGQVAAAERVEADRLGGVVFPLVMPSPATAAVTALAVGLVVESAQRPRAPAAGDALIYLGAPTGREGLSGVTSGGVCPPPSQETQDQTRALLRALHERPGLVLLARGMGRGGLAQAAASLSVGVQLLLDAVPRHPVLLHPKELLLAETLSRALVVVPADRVDEVLALSQGQALVAAAIGAVTAEKRLDALMKPRGATAPRPVCELPLLALHRELPSVEREALPAPRVLPDVHSTEPLLRHLRAHAGPVSGPAVLLPAAALALAVRCVGTLGTRRALAAAVGSVRASGATPVGGICLAGPRGERTGDALAAAFAELGMALVSDFSAAAPGDGLVVVLGTRPAELCHYGFPGPGLLVAVLGFDTGTPAQEYAAGVLCSELVHAGLSAAVHPISEGGLLLALARACAHAGIGCTAVLPVPPPVGEGETRRDELTSEAPGRYLLAIPAHRQADARILASERGVPLWPLGRTGGSELLVRRSDGPTDNPFTQVLRLPVAALWAELRPGESLPGPDPGAGDVR